MNHHNVHHRQPVAGGSASRYQNVSLMLPKPNECTAQSLVASIESFLHAAEKMTGTIMVPSRLKDVELTSDDSDSSTEPPSTVAIRPNGRHGDANIDWNNYHSVYRLLRIAHHELISGTSNDHNEFEEDDDDSEDSRKLVLMFRQHLEGLFALLQLLTGAANHISKRYQDEVVGQDRPSS